jgi:hypothetical protein
MRGPSPSWDAEAPVRLVERVTPDGVVLAWHGAPRPGVVAYDLYDRRLGPRGGEPVRLNAEPLPLAGEWIDTAIHAPVALACDPIAELLEKPSVPPRETVPISYVQGWLDLLTAGHSPPLRGGARAVVERTPAYTHFLLERDGAGKQGAPVMAQQREWTPDLERQRDEAIRRALEELRRRGVTFPGDPPPTLEELERHLVGGITADRGELGREDPPSEGRTSPRDKDPQTGKHQSELTLNGDTVLDAEPERLEALLYHELVHVAQNLDFVVREATKDIYVNRIEREVEAYDHVWTLATGALDMRPGLLIREAREATLAIMKLYRDFARTLLRLEDALTDAQKDLIRALRRKIRALLLRYQAFLAGAPAVAIDALGITNLVEGQPMNTKELVDYLLDRAFR